MENKNRPEITHIGGTQISDIVDNILGRNKVDKIKIAITKLSDDERRELLIFLRTYDKGSNWNLVNNSNCSHIKGTSRSIRDGKEYWMCLKCKTWFEL